MPIIDRGSVIVVSTNDYRSQEFESARQVTFIGAEKWN